MFNSLGFYDEWRFGDRDGGIRRNDMRLLFAEDSDFVADINNQKHCLPLMCFVDNIDEIFSELKRRNIETANNLRSHLYGHREFAFIDINGYYIRVPEVKDEG